jgi:hypothetical protein
MGFPFGLPVVGLTAQLGGFRLSAMGHDPPCAVVEEDDEDRIPILGEPLDSITLAPVGPAQPQAEDAVLRPAWMLAPLQDRFHP